MDNAFVRPRFGIGLALNDKDVSAGQIAGLVQNRFGITALDPKLRAVSDEAGLQFCRQGVFFVRADRLLLCVEQLVSGIEFQEYGISRFVEGASVVKSA